MSPGQNQHQNRHALPREKGKSTYIRRAAGFVVLYVADIQCHKKGDMPAGIAIAYTDHTVDDIRGLARQCKDAGQVRRLQAIGLVMEGTLEQQTLYDWSTAARRKAWRGCRTVRAATARRSWMPGLLKATIARVFGGELSLETVRCLVRAPGLRKLSVRPCHPKANFRRDSAAVDRLAHGSGAAVA